MKKLVLLLLLLPVLLSGQELFQKELIYDEQTLIIADIVNMADTGYMACGSLSSTTLDSTWAVVIRFDSLMNVEWCRSYNMLTKDDFRCIKMLSNGTFLVGGTSRQEFSLSNGSTLYKINSSGGILWHNRYADSYDDASLGVFNGPSGTLVIVVRKGVNGQPAKILKTWDNGDLISARTLETTNSPSGVLPDCVTSDGSNNYYLGGSALNNDTGKWMYYIARISSDDVAWYKEYDLGRDAAYLYGITVLSDGDLAVTGIVKSEDNTNLYTAGVMKVNHSTGSVIWAKELKQTDLYEQYGYRVLALDDAQLLVTGRVATAIGMQAYAARLDADGNVVWGKEYGEGPFETMSKAVRVSGNRLLMLGKMAYDAGPYFVQTTGDGISPCLNSSLSFFTTTLSVDTYEPQTILSDVELEQVSPVVNAQYIDLDENVICSGLVGVELLKTANKVEIFPNPSNGTFKLSLPETMSGVKQIEILNGSGECVYRSESSLRLLQMETSLKPGIYLVRIYKVGSNIHDVQHKIVIH